MKKNLTIAKALMVSMFLFGGAVSANAQFGSLKGLANKAKKAAKEKVEQKAEDTKSAAVGQASEAAGIENPSAEGVVWRWTGKENTFGSWADKMVFTGDRKTDAYKQQLFIHTKIFGEVLKLLTSTTIFGLTDYITSVDKKTCAPWDEVPRYAWTKAFVDNPTWDNFMVFAMVLIYDTPTYMVYLEYPMSNESSGVVNAEKGWMLAWPSKSDMISERRAREEYAIEIAKKKIPLDYICEYTVHQYKRAEGALENGSVGLAQSFFMAEAMKDRIIKDHPNAAASAEWIRKVEAEAAKWEANNREKYRNMIDICGVNNVKPVDMPVGVSVAADIKSNGDAAAKKWAQAANLEYVKTIYLGNKWQAFKSQKFPYPITHYSIPAAVICKKGDKYVMQKMDLQKTVKGQYGMNVGLGAKLTPVNYK